MSETIAILRYQTGRYEEYREIIAEARRRIPGIRVVGNTGERDISIKLNGTEYFGEPAVSAIVGF